MFSFLPSSKDGSCAAVPLSKAPTAPRAQKKVLPTAPVPGLCVFSTVV